jgi:hypothetical protein
MFRVLYVRGMLMVYLCTKFHMPSSVSLLERRPNNIPAVSISLIHYSAKLFYVREDEFLFEDVFPYTISGS